MITLYVDGFFVSPLDASCMIALDEKGVEYQTARALLRDGQGIPPALSGRTVISQVPAMQHGDFYLTESLAIVEYIEDTFAPPAYPRLVPAEPRERARVRQIMAYLRFSIAALREERPWWACVYPTELPALSPRAAREADELADVAARLLGDLGAWNIAHADLAMQLMRLTSNGHAVPGAVKQFVDANVARPSVRRYIDHVRPPNPPPLPAGVG